MRQHIRLARMEDRPAVEAVVAAAYAHYVPRIGRKPAPMLADYGALIGEQRVHVLDRDGVIPAIVVLIPEPGAMLLENVAVRPDAQGLGYGRALLELAERVAREAGYRTIRLYTNAAMAENIALYSRIGYVETHRAEQDGFQRVYMVKTLS